MWDAAQYLKFSDERSRPFLDLLAQVRLESPAQVADLGCGTGSLTRLLGERWPAARVTGVDNAAEMLAQARPLAIPGRLEFMQADLAAWQPAKPVDLILSNAALHWVPDHAALLRRLSRFLAPSGVLAVQMPNRFGTPSQTAVEEAAADPRWAAALQGVGLHRESVLPLEWYVRQLHALGLAVDAWTTTYLHVFAGEHPVLEWLKGTALRPLLKALSASAPDFLAALGERLAAAYPQQNGVTLFPMPRVFFVASRP